MLFFPDPEQAAGGAEDRSSGEDEAPLFHVAPLISFKRSMADCPPREEWSESNIFWWRWFVRHGLVTVDKLMSEDPYRWHLEGLDPIYNDLKEVEMLHAMEELVLEKGE